MVGLGSGTGFEAGGCSVFGAGFSCKGAFVTGLGAAVASPEAACFFAGTPSAPTAAATLLGADEFAIPGLGCKGALVAGFAAVSPEAACFFTGTAAAPVPPAGVPAVVAALLAAVEFGVADAGAVVAGLSGTDGRRCAKMSAARVGAAVEAGASCSSFFVITSTSSRWVRMAAGFTVT